MEPNKDSMEEMTPNVEKLSGLIWIEIASSINLLRLLSMPGRNKKSGSMITSRDGLMTTSMLSLEVILSLL